MYAGIEGTRVRLYMCRTRKRKTARIVACFTTPFTRQFGTEHSKKKIKDSTKTQLETATSTSTPQPQPQP